MVNEKYIQYYAEKHGRFFIEWKTIIRMQLMKNWFKNWILNWTNEITANEWNPRICEAFSYICSENWKMC